MFISAKIKVYTKHDAVYMEVTPPKVFGKHTLRIALHTPIEVNELINDLVKAKNEAFASGAENTKTMWKGRE